MTDRVNHYLGSASNNTVGGGETNHAGMLERTSLLAAIVDASDDAIVAKTLDGVVTTWNAAAEAMYGYSAAEMIGRPISVLSPPGRQDETTTILAKIRAGERIEHYQTVRVRKDGQPIEVSLTVSPIYDAMGQLIGASSIARDVTERERQEAERQQLIDGMNDSALLIGSSGEFLEVNDRAVETLGYSRAELLTMGVADIDPYLSADDIATRTERNRQGDRLLFETKHKTRDGRTIPVEISSSPVSFQGQPAILSIARDITERKQAEEALKLSQAQLEAAMDLANLVNWEFDVDTGRFTFNDRFYALYGTTAELEGGYEMPAEVYAKEFVHPDDQHMVAGEIIKALETTDPNYSAYVEHRIVCRGGEIRHVVVRLEVTKDKDGRTIRTHGANQDITERKRAEAERLQLERRLQQSQRLESLGVLGGGIAHDFNNILMSVLGNAELALSALSPSAPARQNLLEIMASSRRAADLCQQMLAYSGRGKFVTEAIDLRALIEDMQGLLHSVISKKALLKLNLAKDLPPMRGDASQLSQVVMNLVVNASEAIGERSGIITVSTGLTDRSDGYLRNAYGQENLALGPYLSLEVSDTGAGMDEATQERIFEPFFTSKFSGRGLGLSAVLGIVRGHKGALRLDSELGRGTTFKLFFPVSEMDAKSLAREKGASEGDWRGEGTVLLVDDEETLRILGAAMLTRLGFTVLTAADGREALAIYAEHRDEITLVLLDLTMPRMDGEQAFHELRLINPEVRVVVSSGYAEDDITARFVGQGLVGFVHKPYSLAELREQLRVALEGAEPGSGTART